MRELPPLHRICSRFPQNCGAAVNESSDSKTSLLRDRNLHIVFCVTLMAILGVASIAPAFPKIVRELDLTSQAVGLLITVFTLPQMILAPVVGVLSDRYGRRTVLVPSLLIFGIAGGMCGVVQSFNAILVLRLIQGIGSASLGVLTLTIIGDVYTGKDRAAAMGYNASVLNVGTGTYPAIGGALAGLAWYYPFYLAFLAVPVGAFVAFGLRTSEPRSHARISDYLRGVWKVIKDRRAVALMLVSVGTFIILYGSYLTYFPLLLGESFQASSALIGLIMASMSFTTAITSSQLGRLRQRFREITLLRAGFVLYAVSLLIVPHIPVLWLFLIPMVIYGIGHGMSTPSQMTLQASLAPAEQRAAFMSVMGMVLRGGQTLGPLVIGGACAVGGMNSAFTCGAGIALLGIVVLALLYRE